MANTPNMLLPLPTPLVTSDLEGANEISGTPSAGGSNALAIIDAHNHTSGRGVQIPTLGININADLPFNGNGGTLLKYLQLNNQGGNLASSFKGYLYAAPGSGGVPFDLMFNDGNGTVVQITKAGNVNVSAAGAISGLSAPASAAFGSGTFTWQSNTNVPAKMDSGDLVVRKAGATSPQGITITTVNSLAAAYTITLPTGLPASQLPLFLDTTANNGQMSTRQIVSADIGANQVTTDKLPTTNAAVTGALTIGSGTLTSTSLADITSASVSLTLVGTRPVIIGWRGAAADSVNSMQVALGGAGTVTLHIEYDVDGSNVGQYTYSVPFSGASSLSIPCPASVIAGLSPGAHTIKGRYKMAGTAGGSLVLNNMVFYAVEL